VTVTIVEGTRADAGRWIVFVKLPPGDLVYLQHDEACRLVDALWEVSATPGAVIAVGKLNHQLRTAGADGTVEMTTRESAAVEEALERVAEAADGLSELRQAMRP
jgi:hypothetical protein